MKRIIFTDNYSTIKESLIGNADKVHFLCIDITKNIQMIRKKLIDQGLMNRFIEERAWIKRDVVGHDYAQAIDGLTEKNQSFDWWAYNFVSKSPIATKLFEWVAWSVVISNFATKNGMQNGDLLFVLSDDYKIYSQIKDNLKGTCQVSRHVEKKADIKNTIKYSLPIAPFLFFLRRIASKVVSVLMFRKVAKFLGQYKFVFLSLLNQQSFTSENRQYKDFYFSHLLEHLSKPNNRCLNLVLTWPPYVGNLKRLKRSYPDTYDVLPLECIFSFGDLVRVLKNVLRKTTNQKEIKGDFVVQGYSFLKLLKTHKREEEYSAGFSLNYLLYYVGVKIANRFSHTKVVYPFENRAFERMLIKGIKETSADMKLFGYQHAALTKTHLNYFLGDYEKQYMPLPDRIVTTGEIPRNILQKFFGHSDDKLVAGSSLRRSSLNIKNRVKQPEIKNILVIVSTNLEEYKRVLLFIEQWSREEAFSSYQVTIRPHPVIPLSIALKDLPELSFKVHEQSANIPLSEALLEADVVLFASSTVSVEALSAGVPVVYLDVAPFLDNNPLGFSDHECVQVASPSELTKVLSQLNKQEAKSGVNNDYANSYLSERNELLFEQILEKT